MDRTKYPQSFLQKLTWATILLTLGALVLFPALPVPESRRLPLVSLLLVFAGLTVFELKYVVPRLWPSARLIYGNIVFDSLVIAIFDYSLPVLDLSPLYIVVIIMTAMLSTRNASLAAAAFATALELSGPLIHGLTPLGDIQILIRAVVFFATALLVSELASTLSARWRAVAGESEHQRREIEARRDELEGLSDIAQAFGNMADAPEMFRQVTARIARLIGAEVCILARLDDDGKMVRGMPPGYGLSDELISQFEFAMEADVVALWDIPQSDYLILNDPTRLPSSLANIALPMHVRQVIAARMMRRGQPIGLVFAANRTDGKAFEPKDARLLSILAGQAAIAVENARLYGEAQGNLQNLTRLYAISSQLSTRSEPETIPARIVRAMADALNAPIASMALMNEATGRLEYAATLGVPQDAPSYGFRENGLAMTVLRTGQARFVEDIRTADDVHPVTRVWGFRSSACLPIWHGDKHLGVLYVNFSQPHAFTEIEKNMLAIFANQAAVALENARLHRVEQRKAAELEILATLSHSLAETMELEEMLRVVEREVRAGVPLADRGALLIFDAVRRVLEPRAAFGFEREILFKLSLTVDESIPGRVFRAGRSMLFTGEQVIRDIRQQSLRPENQALLAAAGGGHDIPQSVMCVPVSSGTECIGVIVLENHHSAEAFTPDELRLGEAMADRAALAIRNAQLYARGLRRATQLAAVAEVTRRMVAILDLDELLPTVAHLIHTQFGYRYVHLFINDPLARVTGYRAGGGPAAATMLLEKASAAFGEGIVGTVAEKGQGLLANDVSLEPRFLPHPLLPDVQSELALGLQVGTRLIGVLDVQSERRNAFEASDVATLETLAGQIAIAIANAELYGEMQEQARRDSLTQVYNHGYFLERLHAEVEQARVAGHPLSLIMLDIDYFKQYNDRYGHQIGDQVLCEIVQAIQHHVHRTDLVGRWGGEEFSIALLRTDAKAAWSVANRISKTLAEGQIAAMGGKRILPPTVSQGLASFPAHVHDTVGLIDLADTALYRAKSRGRNQICSYDEP